MKVPLVVLAASVLAYLVWRRRRKRMTEDQVEQCLRSARKTADMAKGLASLVALVKAQRAQLTRFEVDVDAFMALVFSGVRLVDVRSPSEFARGHIPGAINVPLFDDAERAAVGTRYKHAGRDEAMALGMTKVAPRLDALASDALGGRHKLCVYCWRGGLRSGAVAWMLRRKPGVHVYCVKGGYKSFRRWARETWGPVENPEPTKRHKDDTILDFNLVDETAMPSSPCCKNPTIVIVAGRTGVGKTKVLHALERRGAQILDLEGLAKHRGSAFGYVGKQPSNEAFENELSLRWRTLNAKKPVFIEDEDLHVGTCAIPKPFYELMSSASVVVRVTADLDQRIAILRDDYGDESQTDAFQKRMTDTIGRLAKRLGPDKTTHLRNLLKNRDYEAAATAMLVGYYDKLYDTHLAKRRNRQLAHVTDVPLCRGDDSAYDADATAVMLLDALRTTTKSATKS